MKLNQSARPSSLPSAWDPRCSGPRLPVHPSSVSNFKLEDLRVTYVGPDSPDAVASVRANCVVPADCQLFYFEIEVVRCREECSISFGFSPDEYASNKLPYYGYSGGGGCLLRGSAPSTSYGPSFGAGDVVGALLNKSDRSISFFKNGIDLGVAVTDVEDDEQLCPSVAMHSRDDTIVANFGSTPFRLDIDLLSSDCLSQALAQVRASRLTPAGGGGSDSSSGSGSEPLLASQLVMDYLTHHRCFQTLAAMKGELAAAGPGDEALLRDLQQRQQVFDAVVRGDIDDALRLMERHYSLDGLHQHARIFFRLKCQKFVELVRRGEDCQAALDYARAELTPTPHTSEEQELLADALSLLAYLRPENSPSASLLSHVHRACLAEDVNGMLLEVQGRPRRPALERCYQQVHVCLEELKQRNNVKACAIDRLSSVLL